MNMRMGESARRALPIMLLASTMLVSAGVAHAAEAVAASVSGGTTLGEVIVTASKREENLQKVAVSVQAIDARTIKQLNITSFNDYVKFIPSIQADSGGPPNTSIIYMRGISDGGNGNHSGPQPSVGTYFDDSPVTTIGGTLDIHIYDIARIEVLPGPQGTLYGASSEAGTLKIVSNQPSTSGFSGALDVDGNLVDHGSEGYVVEGFVNVPLSSNAAIRLVAFDEHDAGYIDNVFGTRYFPSSDNTINNSQFVKKNFNGVDTFGGRLALKYDINNNWTVTPSVIVQDTRADGTFAYEPSVGQLEVQRFAPDSDHDRFVLAGLTIKGKIGRYDLTYAGSYFNRKVNENTDYTDYSVAYDQTYGSGAYWTDKNGVPLANPQQEIIENDRFEKGSNEIRIASPSTDRFRFLAGLFQERQTHWIVQDYQIQGFSPDLSVAGWPNTIWLTDQNRIDRDEAAFGEASFDISNKLSLTGGMRYYHYDNTLYGFYGYSSGYSPNGQGESTCSGFPGQTFRNAPCVNLNRSVADSGETYKGNLSYKIDDNKLVYFTYSTGYRPGGVNRRGALPPYKADSLTNYELGWKTSWLDNSLRWNGAVYDEEFQKFQFAVLFPASLTLGSALTGVQNAPSARIRGLETSVDWRASDHLTFSAGASYNHAVLAADFCGVDDSGNPFSNCTGQVIQAPKGEQLPFTPKFKGNITGRYAWEVRDWTAHFQASLQFQTSTSPALKTADIEPLGMMPGYATVDFSIGADHGNTSVEMFIKNATDTRGQTNRFSPCPTCETPAPNASIPPSQQVAPAVYVSVIQPLTVGIRLGQKF